MRPLALALVPLAILAGDPRYLEDFEFIAGVVRREAASLASKKIDWSGILAEFRPRFERCKDDAEHVRNVMELLATLRDSHTGILETKVESDALPGKFDGLFGGGLWFGWDQGKFVLRGVMAGHPLERAARPGSILLTIDGEPAWLAMERERRRVARFLGLSSDHSFFASLGNRMLPFGDRKEIAIELMLPGGETKRLDVARWGPGGRAFYPGEAFLPAGLSWGKGAVSTFVASASGRKTGYLAITGGMDAPTVAAFHHAVDALKGMEALILDARSAGGGSDAAAWEMAGRFFARAVSNGRHGRIEPSGSWQFEGPVVVLQSEVDVSSAETFVWAMTETGRAISVGRPTGGWGIIPKRFDCPSGLVAFRVGVNDRPTPIKGVHTEGVGWPPDVLIPFGPEMLALGDPEQKLAHEILAVLGSGAPLREVREAFQALFTGAVPRFRAFVKKAGRGVKGFDGEALAKLVASDLSAEIELERQALRPEDVVPDAAGAARRLPALAARAKAAGLSVADLERAIGALKAETAAQEAFLEIAAPGFDATPPVRKAWLQRHGKTKTGSFVREKIWK